MSQATHMIADVAHVLRVLCNPKRLAVLLCLASGPATAVQIQRATGARGEALRKHLMDLRKARLVTRPRWARGPQVAYLLAADRVRVTDDDVCILASGYPIMVGRCPLVEGEL